MDGRDIALTIVFALAGGLVGWVYLLLVRRSVAYLGKGKTQTATFVTFMLVRFALLGCGFAGAAYFGAWPLIGHLAGFFIVRTIMVGRAGAGAIAAATSAPDRRSDADHLAKDQKVNG